MTMNANSNSISQSQAYSNSTRTIIGVPPKKKVNNKDNFYINPNPASADPKKKEAGDTQSQIQTPSLKGNNPSISIHTTPDKKCKVKELDKDFDASITGTVNINTNTNTGPAKSSSSSSLTHTQENNALTGGEKSAFSSSNHSIPKKNYYFNNTQGSSSSSGNRTPTNTRKNYHGLGRPSNPTDNNKQIQYVYSPVYYKKNEINSFNYSSQNYPFMIPQMNPQMNHPYMNLNYADPNQNYFYPLNYQYVNPLFNDIGQETKPPTCVLTKIIDNFSPFPFNFKLHNDIVEYSNTVIKALSELKEIKSFIVNWISDNIKSFISSKFI